MAADIFAELSDRGVAPLGLLAQRHQQDVVEIALELFTQARHGSVGGRCGHAGCTDETFDLAGGLIAGVIRAVASENLV